MISSEDKVYYLGQMAFLNPDCVVNIFPIDEYGLGADSMGWMLGTLDLDTCRCLMGGYLLFKRSKWCSYICVFYNVVKSHQTFPKEY